MASWPYSTARWKMLRASKLSEQPLCEVCSWRGQVVLASHVDHVVAIKAGGPPFPALDGLMSMCASCHSVKTAATDNPHAFGTGWRSRFKGCGADGSPLDPDDPWWGRGADQDEGSGAEDRRVASLLELVVANDSQEGEIPWV